MSEKFIFTQNNEEKTRERKKISAFFPYPDNTYCYVETDKEYNMRKDRFIYDINNKEETRLFLGYRFWLGTLGNPKPTFIESDKEYKERKREENKKERLSGISEQYVKSKDLSVLPKRIQKMIELFKKTGHSIDVFGEDMMGYFISIDFAEFEIRYYIKDEYITLELHIYDYGDDISLWEVPEEKLDEIIGNIYLQMNTIIPNYKFTNINILFFGEEYDIPKRFQKKFQKWIKKK